jgi:hypothetical protein
MRRKKRQKERSQTKTYEHCSKLHLETMAKVKVMEELLRQRGQTPVHEWSPWCKAYHIGATGTPNTQLKGHDYGQPAL